MSESKDQAATDRTPHLVVIGGPNGAGKSTIAPLVLRGTLGVTEFVNADVIAQGLSAFQPEREAIPAGRIMLARLKESAAAREDFAFETTLASRSFAPWIRVDPEIARRRVRLPPRVRLARRRRNVGEPGGGAGEQRRAPRAGRNGAAAVLARGDELFRPVPAVGNQLASE